MDISFRGLIGNYVVVYIDDITMFSKDKKDHVSHLRKIFKRCRRYGISLNPKKSIFSINKGRFLGFVLSKDGMIIELK